MTERNFTEVIPGWYRTRGGDVAEIFQIRKLTKNKWPVRGLIRLHEYRWTTTGSNSSSSRKSKDDLIEYLGTEKPRKKKMVKQVISHWVNVYTRYTSASFTAEAYADDAAGPGRIACVELTGEYEVEVDDI